MPVNLLYYGQILIISVFTFKANLSELVIQSGVSLSVLQEMEGWESIEMGRRYARLAPGHLTEHAAQIDSIF
ncbi:site-specific integrase [Rahnella ecdela]|uniref:Integrase n=1 Tax=Rahnella ecdela TaxID=2816250 RepID=A0ABS6LLD0_9GAMM|nr:hypothetical protein [Rahnella ecdela]